MDHNQLAMSLTVIDAEIIRMRVILRSNLEGWDSGHVPREKLSLLNLENIATRLRAECSTRLFHSRPEGVPNFLLREIYYGNTE